MKIIITKDSEYYDKSYKVISNLNQLDFFCSDAECTNVIVDNYISMYPYKELPSLVAKICSKVRLGGEIQLIDADLELLAYKLSVGLCDLESINEALFAGGVLCSLTSIDHAEEMLKPNGIKITYKEIVNNQSFIIKGIRC
jgi:hypothetical protein